MKKTRKGFTIVELIIVIAVIGVLTAVLVPTIIHLVSKANKASDEALITNLNKSLAIRENEPDDKPNSTLHDAVLDVKEFGYDLETIDSKSDQSILWNQNDNRFYLEDRKDANVPDHQYWRIQNDANEQKYSIYAGPKFAKTAKVEVTGVGFDIGYHDGNTIGYEVIEEVVYYSSNKTDHSITNRIRTSGQRYTQDTKNDQAFYDSIYRYDTAGVVELKKNHTASYHEAGEVSGSILVHEGHIVFETKKEYRVVVKSSGVTASNPGSANIELYNGTGADLNTSNFNGIPAEVVTEAKSADNFKEIKDFTELKAAINNLGNDNPTLFLSSKEYQFTEKLELKKSVAIVGTPGYTTLKGYGVKDIDEGGKRLDKDTSVHAEAFFINTTGNNDVNIRLEGFINDHFAYYNLAGNPITVGKSTRQLSFIRYSTNCPASTTVTVNNVYLNGTDRTFIDMLDTYTYSPADSDGCAGTLNLNNVVFDGTDRLCDNINAINALGEKSANGTDYKLAINVDNCEFIGAQASYPSEFGSTAICIWGNTNLTVTNSKFEDCETGIYSCHAYYWWRVNIFNKVTTENNSFIDCDTCINIDDFENSSVGYAAFFDTIIGVNATNCNTLAYCISYVDSTADIPGFDSSWTVEQGSGYTDYSKNVTHQSGLVITLVYEI